MAQYVASTLRRGQSGVGEFAVAEFTDLKLSDTIAIDLTARNNIEEWRRTPHMSCYVISEDKTYRLGSDVTIVDQVWTEVLYADPNALVYDDVFDDEGFVKPELLRNLFINDSFVVSSEAEMLALSTVTGNVVVRSDTGAVFLKLNNDDPSDISDFANISSSSGAVTSVNGMTGAVSVSISNLLANPTNLTDFNAAVANNALVLSHSASISNLTSYKADLVSGVVPLSQLPYVFQSGLERTGSEVTLGGPLLYDTVIDLGLFNFKFNKNSSGQFGFDLGSDADYDIYYRGSDGYLKRLAKGSDGQVLKVSGGVLVYSSDLGGTSESSAVWGNISGTITDQTDLISYIASQAYSDEKAQDAVGGILGNTSDIAFTYNDSTPSITAAIVNGSVTNSKLATVAALSVKGNATNSIAAPSDIAGTDGQLLRVNGTSLGFGNDGLNSLIFKANQGIDVATTGGTDTLNIGTSNADIINIGHSTTTVNIQGTLVYQNVINLTVTDKLITLNKGGATSSGSSSGFEIEENNVITGWFTTDGTRNGFEFKAPAISSKATFLLSSLTSNRSFTLPDAAGTFLVSGATNTLTADTVVVGSSYNFSFGVVPFGGSINTFNAKANTINLFNVAGQNGIVIDVTGMKLVFSGTRAAGDMHYYDASDYLVRLPIGASSRVLTSTGSVPQWAQVNLSTMVTGRVAYSNIPQATGLSVIGRNVNSTGDFAAIGPVLDHQVLRRFGSTLGFGALDLSSLDATENFLPIDRGGTNTNLIGNAGDYVIVNPTEDGYTFTSVGGGGGGGVPTPTAGDLGKMLRVDATETAYELFIPTSDPTTTDGDLIQRSGGVLARIAAVATGNVPLSGGVGTPFSWGKVTLTGHVSGILPVANGGTGSSTQNWIGGTSGTVDNALLRSDGTGTKTAQASNITLDDGAGMTWANSSLTNQYYGITIAQTNANRGFSFAGFTGTGALKITADTGLFVDGVTSNIRVGLYASFGPGVFAQKIGATSADFTFLAANGISGSTAGQNAVIQAGNGLNSGNTNGGNITLTPGTANGTGTPGKVFIDGLTIGKGAGGFATNTVFGNGALASYLSSASFGLNVALGYNALNANTSDPANTAVGTAALTLANNSGSSGYNAAFGYNAGGKVTTGQGNTLLGTDNASAGLTTGNWNIFVGYQNSTGPGVTTGSDNVIIGSKLTGLSSSLANNFIMATNAVIRFQFDGTLWKTNYDVAVIDATKGIILKDTQGTPHYWRVTINNSGVLQTADLGTSI